MIGITALILSPNSSEARRYHEIAPYTPPVTWVIPTFLWILSDKSTTNFQFVCELGWIAAPTGAYKARICAGSDGIPPPLVVLTTFLTPIRVLIGRNAVKSHVREYMICFSPSELSLILTLCVLDLVLFYILFESILMPMMIIIGIRGSRERKIGAAYQSFLHTSFGSVFSLLAILAIYSETGTTDIQISLTTRFDANRQIPSRLAFLASFAVKVPMIPVHTWLPEAHVEAPTAGSVTLAGVSSKLGGYGFLRFSIPMFPEASIYFAPLIYVISVVAIIYVSPTTPRQIDSKKIIAYSPIAHTAFVTLGIFTYNPQAIEGSISPTASHGIVSSASSMCIGVPHDRHKARVIKYHPGLIQVMPLFMTIPLIFSLANLSMPATAGFVGEFLILVGLFQSNRIIAFLAGSGMVLGAAYSIWSRNRIACGNLKIHFIKTSADVNHREIQMFIPSIFSTPSLGVYPEIALDTIHVPVGGLSPANV